MTALGTRLLKLTIGGTDYTAQVSRAKFVSGPADSDFQTFEDAANGGAREYRLNFIAVQDTATGTLWDRIWSAAGTTVAGILKPYGNAAASAGQPHYTFNATITEPDGDLLGGDANASTTARFTVECSWVLDAKPVKVTA